jgi:hypothetical protein
LAVPEGLNIGLDADNELGRIVLRVDALAGARRAYRQPRGLRFPGNLHTATVLDDAPDLTRGLVAAARQQLQHQVDRAAYQTKPAHPHPDAAAGKPRSAAIFDLRFIGSV